MEALFIWIVIVIALVALDAGAMRWGDGLARPDAGRPSPLSRHRSKDRRRTTCTRILFLATEIDRERRAAAARSSLVRRVRASGDARPFTLRRRLALALAAVSRASAAAVRRLDARLADELVGRTASAR